MTTTAEQVLDRNALEVAAIAERLGASEEEVRQALADSEAVRTVMRERQLSEDHAIFLLVANAQARRRRDAIVTVPT